MSIIMTSAAPVMLWLAMAGNDPARDAVNYQRFMAGEIRLEQLSPEEALQVVKLARSKKGRRPDVRPEECQETSSSSGPNTDCRLDPQ